MYERGLTDEGRRAVKLPDEHWKEHKFYLHGNPDDGKTYFKHDITKHLTFQLPPGCNNVTKICFEKFGTLFLNHSAIDHHIEGAPVNLDHLGEDSISEHYLSTDDEEFEGTDSETDYDFEGCLNSDASSITDQVSEENE